MLSFRVVARRTSIYAALPTLPETLTAEVSRCGDSAYSLDDRFVHVLPLRPKQGMRHEWRFRTGLQFNGGLGKNRERRLMAGRRVAPSDDSSRRLLPNTQTRSTSRSLSWKDATSPEPWNKASSSVRKLAQAKDIWAIQSISERSRMRDLPVQPGHRQQAARRDLVKLRYVTSPAGQCSPAMSCRARPAASPVRADRANPLRRCCLDRQGALKSEDYLFRANTSSRTSPLATTRASSSLVSTVDWIRQPTAPYMRRTKATLIYKRTRTFAPFSCCWGTPSWKARSVLGIESMTRWRSPSKLRSDGRTVVHDCPRVVCDRFQEVLPGGQSPRAAAQHERIATTYVQAGQYRTSLVSLPST